MAEIITVAGEIIPVNIPLDGPEQLEFLQKSVGGYIEIVPLWDGRLMVLNEEGKLKGLPINHIATFLFIKGKTYRNSSYPIIDFIVGDVVVCEKTEIT